MTKCEICEEREATMKILVCDSCHNDLIWEPVKENGSNELEQIADTVGQDREIPND